MKDRAGVFLGLQYTSGTFPASCHANEVSFLSTTRVGGGLGAEGRLASRWVGSQPGAEGRPTSPRSSRRPADPQGDL